jgi:glutathione S-transferase
MKLYYAPGTCALAIHAALIWAKAPYELEKVQIGSEEYKKINPLGAVPAVLEKGVIMTQCDAILKYICKTQPQAKLDNGSDAIAAQQLDQWLAFLGGDLHPAFVPFFNPGRYTTATDKDSLAAVRAAANLRLHTLLTALDNHLQGRRWFLGDHVTVLDAYCYTMMRWASYTDLKREDYANISKHFALLASDEGIIRAETEQGLRR